MGYTTFSDTPMSSNVYSIFAKAVSWPCLEANLINGLWACEDLNRRAWNPIKKTLPCGLHVESRTRLSHQQSYIIMPYHNPFVNWLPYLVHVLSISYLSIRQRAWPQSNAALSSLLHHSWHISRRTCGRSSAANRAPEICQRHQHGPWKGHRGAPVYDPLQCLYRSQKATKCHKHPTLTDTHWLIDSLTMPTPFPIHGMRMDEKMFGPFLCQKFPYPNRPHWCHGPSEVQLGVGHWACSVIVLGFCRFSSCSPDHDSISRASAVEQWNWTRLTMTCCTST